MGVGNLEVNSLPRCAGNLGLPPRSSDFPPLPTCAAIYATLLNNSENCLKTVPRTRLRKIWEPLRQGFAGVGIYSGQSIPPPALANVQTKRTPWRPPVLLDPFFWPWPTSINEFKDQFPKVLRDPNRNKGSKALGCGKYSQAREIPTCAGTEDTEVNRIRECPACGADHPEVHCASSSSTGVARRNHLIKCVSDTGELLPVLACRGKDQLITWWNKYVCLLRRREPDDLGETHFEYPRRSHVSTCQKKASLGKRYASVL